MKRVLLSLLILPLLYSVVYAQPPAGPPGLEPADVFVTNDETTPIPVEAVITNDETTPLPVDAVITNDETMPVPVDVTNTPNVIILNSVPMVPGGEPFQDEVFGFSVGQITRIVSNPGKRLEIQHISLSTLMPTGTTTACFVFIAEQNLVIGTHRLVLHLQGVFPGGDSYAASTPITMFARDGAELVFTCSNANANPKNLSAFFSGRWYDE